MTTPSERQTPAHVAQGTPITTAIFVSGTGSNMKAIIEHAQHTQTAYAVSLVVTNNPHAPALAYAQKQGIATAIIATKNTIEFDAEANALMEKHRITIIALAGFMRLLSPGFIDHNKDRNRQIINIHPSLLPRYRGLNTHQRALIDFARDSKNNRHGCTIHHVTARLDDGPIIEQAAIHIQPNDTEVILAARVLAEEHKLFPRILDNLANSIRPATDKTNNHNAT